MAPVVTDVDVLAAALSWSEQGRSVVLATVIQTWGSAPRRAGSHLAIRSDHGFVGSVSGGCVEGAVVRQAMEVFRDGSARTVSFGVADADAWEVGLACGGEISILLTPLGSPELEALRRCLDGVRRRAPVGLWLPLAGGLHCVDDGAPIRWREAMEPRMRRAQCVRLPSPTGEIFLRPFPPAVRVVVIGAVHIAAALLPMLELLGHEAVVVDPRRGFGPPDADGTELVLRSYPDEAMDELGLDARTAVLALTHDPKIDDPGLICALASPAFYIGALGSRSTHGRRLERLEERGVPADTLGRIHGPIGLDIGASTPAEIAVSIVAELTSALRKGA